jgi:hypothetical protein
MNHRIKVIVQGDHAEHEIESPRMNEADAKEQLAKIRAAIQSADGVDLDWLTTRPGAVITASLVAIRGAASF